MISWYILKCSYCVTILEWNLMCLFFQICEIIYKSVGMFLRFFGIPLAPIVLDQSAWNFSWTLLGTLGSTWGKWSCTLCYARSTFRVIGITFLFAFQSITSQLRSTYFYLKIFVSAKQAQNACKRKTLGSKASKNARAKPEGAKQPRMWVQSSKTETRLCGVFC